MKLNIVELLNHVNLFKIAVKLIGIDENDEHFYTDFATVADRKKLINLFMQHVGNPTASRTNYFIDLGYHLGLCASFIGEYEDYKSLPYGMEGLPLRLLVVANARYFLNKALTPEHKDFLDKDDKTIFDSDKAAWSEIDRAFRRFDKKSSASFLDMQTCCFAYAWLLDKPESKTGPKNKEILNQKGFVESFSDLMAFEIAGKAHELLGYWDTKLSEMKAKREGSFKSTQSKEKADNIKITEKILDNPKYKRIKKPWDNIAIRLEVQQSTGIGERSCIDYIKAAYENKKRDFDARP